MIIDNKKPVILVVENIYSKGKRVFDSIVDMEIIVAPNEENNLSTMVKEKNPFAVVLGVEKYTTSFYEAMKKGGIIARFGVGCDGIDFEKAKNKNLFITNTPNVLESTVAEFTVFLAAEVLRKTGIANENIKRGEWLTIIGNELKGKTWAIIGFGKIGKRLSKILSFGFGVRVFAYKKNIIESEKILKEYGVEKIFSDYEEILPFADIVSLHLPAKKDTYHFLNSNSLTKLKLGAILINTARGSLVDENALYDVLKNGRISGVGLDVFENEPYSPVHPDKDLRNLPNVFLTPHIASSTEECCKRMAERVMQNIRFGVEAKYDLMDIVTE